MWTNAFSIPQRLLLPVKDFRNRIFSTVTFSRDHSTHRYQCLPMLKTNLRFFLRSLLKHRIFTAINVLGLSIGICSCLVIFLITSYQLSFDTFHPDKQRIYRIVGAHSGFVQDPFAAAARREIGGFESVAGFYIYYAKVTIPGGSGEPRKFDEPK